MLAVRVVYDHFTSVRYGFFDLTDTDLTDDTWIDGMPGELIPPSRDFVADVVKPGHTTISSGLREYVKLRVPKLAGLLPSVRLALDRLRDVAGFRVHPGLYDRVLQDEGET